MRMCGFLSSRQLWFLLSLMFVSGAGIGLVLPSLDALITEGIEQKQHGTITSLATRVFSASPRGRWWRRS